jgi:hypothetical protein
MGNTIQPPNPAETLLAGPQNRAGRGDEKKIPILTLPGIESRTCSQKIGTDSDNVVDHIVKV